MKKSAIILTLAMLAIGWTTTSCLSDGEDTIIVENGNPTDIPSDTKATPNPDIPSNNATIPNIQYTTVDEDGVAVLRIDMTGIQDKSTLEWLRLLGTGEPGQNIWVEVDGKPKGIKVYNTADSEETSVVPVELIFLVDNSGSMSEEADVIARDITEWAKKLEATGLNILFGCVGYDGEITGACTPCDAASLYNYLQKGSGTSRTVGFEGTAEEIAKYKNARSNYRTGGESTNECGMAALRFADENFKFRKGANRIYVNFTDEPNQSAGITEFSVESLLTNWDTSKGTIHTVFSNGNETKKEYNYLMSEYTGGTTINTNRYFTDVTLESLPVTSAMMNSYIIRFTNIKEFMDGKPHEVHITIYDGNVHAERIFYVVFEDEKKK